MPNVPEILFFLGIWISRDLSAKGEDCGERKRYFTDCILSQTQYHPHLQKPALLIGNDIGNPWK
jgi:hypothetical protein